MRTSLPGRLSLILIWLLVTSSIAFMVARYAVESAPSDNMLPIPEIALDQRETVSKSTQFISPIVSTNATVQEEDGTWYLEGPVTPAEAAYRLLEEPVGVKALINGGPSEFNCVWTGLSEISGGGVAAQCEIPDSVPVAAGMTGRMVIQLEEPQEAEAIPVTAVVGVEDTGEVLVVSNGNLVVRTVELGSHDPFWIEITSGLDAQDVVLAYPTQSDFAKATRP